MWEIEYTDEFKEWWDSLSEAAQEDVEVKIILLKELGPSLQFPHSSEIKGSAYSHMRELRVQHKGRPFRVLYAFDPKRKAVLLIGGDKTGKDRWYKKFIAIADKLYKKHLKLMGKEVKPTWQDHLKN